MSDSRCYKCGGELFTGDMDGQCCACRYRPAPEPSDTPMTAFQESAYREEIRCLKTGVAKLEREKASIFDNLMLTVKEWKDRCVKAEGELAEVKAVNVEVMKRNELMARLLIECGLAKEKEEM